MLKIVQDRLQQYVTHELLDIQAGFRKGRETRDQIAKIRCIIEKARELQKNIYSCFIDYAKAFDCVDHNKLENSERDGNNRPPDLPLEKIMASGPVTSWQIDGETVETVTDFILAGDGGGAPKSLQMVISAMKLKDTYSLAGKL